MSKGFDNEDFGAFEICQALWRKFLGLDFSLTGDAICITKRARHRILGASSRAWNPQTLVYNAVIIGCLAGFYRILLIRVRFHKWVIAVVRVG